MQPTITRSSGSKPGADKAAALRRAVHPLTAADRARTQVAWDLVAEVRGLDRQLAVISKRLQDSVTALGSRAGGGYGGGSAVAARSRSTRLPKRSTPRTLEETTTAAVWVAGVHPRKLR
jgi:hypothetical protein